MTKIKSLMIMPPFACSLLALILGLHCGGSGQSEGRAGAPQVPAAEHPRGCVEAIPGSSVSDTASSSLLPLPSLPRKYLPNTSQLQVQLRFRGYCSAQADSVTPTDCSPRRLLCPWDLSGKNTRMGCHSLLQGFFPTQGLNLGLWHCRQVLYCLSCQGSGPRRVDSPALSAPDIPGGGCPPPEPGGCLVTAHRHRRAAGGLSGTYFWEI